MADGKTETDKACAFCGEIFLCKQRRIKFCSDNCIFGADRKRALARYYRIRELREVETRQCSYCKEDFDTKNYHKTYCCPEHRMLAVKKMRRTPESMAKHKEANKRYRLNEKEAKKKCGWTRADRKKYGSKYYQEVIKPRLQREEEAEAEALMKASNKIPPIQLQRLTAEQISRCWGRIV